MCPWLRSALLHSLARLSVSKYIVIVIHTLLKTFPSGPLVGGFISDALGWRWLYWIQLILAGFVYALMVLTVPETYAPTILLRRARRLRKETGDPTYVTEQEISRRPLSEELKIYFLRPFQLLFVELIVFLISLYMSVLYGLLYMFFVA